MSPYSRLIGAVVALWYDDVFTDDQCYRILKLIKTIDKECDCDA